MPASAAVGSWRCHCIGTLVAIGRNPTELAIPRDGSVQLPLFHVRSVTLASTSVQYRTIRASWCMTPKD
jgi:hypothetical protein